MSQNNQKTLANAGFLKAVSISFREFLMCGTSRSTAKLKPLHGAVAQDMAIRLGAGYSVKSQGWDDDREGKIQGRYIDKMVDITICKGDEPVAGIAVKFVMQNYSQNSNNYFENMLGETANIRCKGIPYFQIFIILDRLPYYNKEKKIIKWETFTEHNVEKYKILSEDNIDRCYHTPNKTLIYVVHLPGCGEVEDKDEYLDFYRNEFSSMKVSGEQYPQFGPVVVLNDYETFAEKVFHAIRAL